MKNRRAKVMGGIVCLGVMGPIVGLQAHPNHYSLPPSPVADCCGSFPAESAAPVQAAARLSVTIIDAKLGEPTPVRVRITDENGNPVGLGITLVAGLGGSEPRGARLAVPGSVVGLPPEAIGVMYGPNDSAQGYAYQPDGAFYVNGSFDMPFPAGKFSITISKGYEYVRETDALVLKSGEHLSRKYQLRRWIDMPGRGWYSADDHIHLRRSPRENPLIRSWIAAEDVHVGILLQMGDFWTTYFSQYGWGKSGRYGAGRFILTSGQEEPRTHGDLGHTISLGAEAFARFQNDYYSYDRVFDRIKELGGVSGYAHGAVSFNGSRGMTLDVLDGKMNFLEVMQFCVAQGPLALENYYRFLDLGYKLTALGGSDFPWCGRSPRFGLENVGPQIGDARFYTYTGNPFSFERWLEGVKAGNTFVTTGPMLKIRVNDRLPGSSLDIKPGTKLKISATAYGHPSQIPLQRLQIIGHRNVLAEVGAGAPGQTPGKLSVELELKPEHGIWIAARADAAPHQVAHTTPVYVTVNGDGFHDRSNLEAQIELAKRYLQEIRELMNPASADNVKKTYNSTPGIWLYPGAVARMERRIAAAEKTLEELRSRR